MFFLKLFAVVDTWEDVLLRTDTWCFSESCLRKERMMFCWVDAWENSHVWKGCKYNPTDSVALVHLATLWWSSSGFADTGLLTDDTVALVCYATPDRSSFVVTVIGRNMPKNFWYFLPHFRKLRLIIGRRLQLILTWTAVSDLAMVFMSGSSDCCWFMWTELLISTSCWLSNSHPLLQNKTFGWEDGQRSWLSHQSKKGLPYAFLKDT